MKQSIIYNIRNWIHPFAAAVLFLRIGLALNLSYDMTREDSIFITILQMILVSLFGGGIPALVLGAVYEVPYKLWVFGEPVDSNDIWRSGLGGPVGFGLACACPFFPLWIVNVLLVIVGILFTIDLVFAIIKKTSVK